MADGLEVHIDTGDLLRMDSKTQMELATSGVKGAVYKPNEAREMFNLPPVEGGDSVYAQQQDFSLSALAQRDSQNPLAAPATAAPAAAATPTAEEQKALLDLFRKSVGLK